MSIQHLIDEIRQQLKEVEEAKRRLDALRFQLRTTKNCPCPIKEGQSYLVEKGQDEYTRDTYGWHCNLCNERFPYGR